MALAFANLLVQAANTAQAASSPEFDALMLAYDNALNEELEKGAPSRQLTMDTLEKFNSFVNVLGADSTQFKVVWWKYYVQAGSVLEN